MKYKLCILVLQWHTMSEIENLRKILMESVKAKRKILLQFILQHNDCRELSIEERSIFLDIFEQFYTVPADETKFSKTEISGVSIEMCSRGLNKCFWITVGDCKYPCSIRKLSGYA